MIIFLALLTQLRAQTIPLHMLSAEDFDVAATEFAASATFSSVSGAGTLGTFFGFELGAVAGATSTPGLHDLARRADASANVTRLPTAAAFAALTVPLGITLEAGAMPRVGSGDFQFANTSFALKWTPTRVFFDLPLDLAVRAGLTTASLKFKARVDDVETAANFDASMRVIEFVASKNFGILTPFVAAGATSGRADLVANSASVFEPALTTDQSAHARPGGALYRAGVELHLLILNLSTEYEHLLGADRFNAKLTAGF